MLLGDALSKLPENCPVCGNRMEKGYLYLSGPGIYWGRKKRVFPKLGLIAGKRWDWFGSVIEAHMCTSCRLVLFYGERIQPTEALSEAPEGLREQLPENCPVCGKRVEKGYMYVFEPGVYWARRRQRFPKAEYIAGKYSVWTYRSIIEAFMCTNCKLVLFYGEKTQRAEARLPKTSEEP